MNATAHAPLDWTVLDLDYAAEADRIAARLREITARQLHRRGLVVAISGGIDSSASVSLAVCILFLVFGAIGLPIDANSALCFAGGLSLRLLAIRHGWQLPTFSYHRRWD